MQSKLFFVVAFVVSTITTYAEDYSDGIKPQWVNNLPQPSNSSYIFVSESSEAPTLQEARQDCFISMLEDAGFEKGVSIKSEYESLDSEQSRYVNGISTESGESKFFAHSTVKGKEVEIQGIKIDEFWVRKSNGHYYLTTLYARSNLDKPAQFDNITLTTKYGCKGLWRSAIVPGWGQFYKGSYLKGGLILGGSVALIGGIIYTQSQRTDYINKIGKTHDANIKKAYATKRDHFTTGRNICIGGLAALYVYNLVDAIVAPGARRVVVSKRDNSSFSYAIAPTILDDGSPAIAAAITF